MDNENDDLEINTLCFVKIIIYKWIHSSKVKSVFNRRKSNSKKNILGKLADRNKWLSEAGQYNTKAIIIEAYITIFARVTETL